MPAGRLERYRRDQVTLRPNVWRDGRLAHDRTWYLKHHLEGIIRSEHDTLLSPDYDLTDYYRHYYAAVSSMDDQVGHALDRLDASGQAGRTIVMFTADHGDNLGSHHLFNKETMNEESIRIPWIVHGPGVAAGAVGDDGPVSLVDVPSTILGLAGAAVPAHFQGVDRSQQVRCGHAAGTGSVFIEGMQDDIAIRTATHKLAMRMQGGWNNRPARTISDDEIQFFDLRMDPYEQHNLAKGGEQRAVAENLKQRLRAWDAATPWMA